MPSVAVIGASSARHKYGNRAVRAYLRQGWTVYPVNPNETDHRRADGLRQHRRHPRRRWIAHRCTCPPAVGEPLLAEIKRKGVKELFVNPGAESDALIERGRAAGARAHPGLQHRGHRRAAVSDPGLRPDRSAAAPAVSNMLELIGGTPLVRLRHLPGPGGADVFVKCEQFNPGGSVKDRVALAMIERAEREGKLVPGQVGHRRADLGQHRRRAGAGGGGQALPADPDHAGEHVDRAAHAAEGLRRRGDPDARPPQVMNGAVDKAARAVRAEPRLT